MAFCDYCKCEMCCTGVDDLGFKEHHAQTSDDKWICLTCYKYDICTAGENRSWSGPCDEMNCIHRPKIIG